MLHKKKYLTVLFLISVVSVKAQNKLNLTLKHQLDSMYVLDQKYRKLVSVKLDSNQVDSLTKLYHVSKHDLSDHLWKLQSDADSTNVNRAEAIIKQYGYPGKSLVSIPTNEAVFFILQHSTLIDKYLPLVKQAADSKELPFYLYAMMKDRSLMYNKKEQLWGSQAKGMNIIDKTTGKAKWTYFIWPVTNPENVNNRRKQAGFEQTVEENAKRLGLTYKAYTLQQVKNGEVN